MLDMNKLISKVTCAGYKSISKHKNAGCELISGLTQFGHMRPEGSSYLGDHFILEQPAYTFKINLRERAYTFKIILRWPAYTFFKLMLPTYTFNKI